MRAALARFVRAHHVDHVSAPIAQAERLQPKNRFYGAPPVIKRDLAVRIQRLGGFVKAFVEEIEHSSLAAVLED